MSTNGQVHWTDHATREQLHILQDPRQHGSRTFRMIVGNLLDASVCRLVKSRLPEKDHRNWDIAWSRNKNDHLILGLKAKIEDIMEELDNKTGAHGHKGAAWMDKKWEELKGHFHMLTS